MIKKIHSSLLLALLFSAMIFSACSKKTPEPVNNNNQTGNDNNVLEAYFRGKVDGVTFDHTHLKNGYELYEGSGGTGAFTYYTSIQKTGSPSIQLDFSYVTVTNDDDRGLLTTIFTTGTKTFGVEASEGAGSYKIKYNDGSGTYYYYYEDDEYTINITEVTDLGLTTIDYGFYSYDTKAVRIKGNIPEVKVYIRDYTTNEVSGTKILTDVEFSIIMTENYKEEGE